LADFQSLNQFIIRGMHSARILIPNWHCRLSRISVERNR